MPHFNVFITEPVTTRLDRFFAVFCGPGPRSLISEAFWDRTGPRSTSFWACFKCRGYAHRDPYPYPPHPYPDTRVGSKTRDMHYI